ncbi:MAG: hypothetical protein AAF681_05470 [Pseudomonadota bacterium]
MTDVVLSKTRFFEGVWEGVVSAASDDHIAPKITVTHLQEKLPDVSVSGGGEPGEWLLRIPVPAEKIADGVQTFVISDEATGETLDSFSIIAGEALSEDIRAEVTLLREELDMLKRAFRRHCLETT